MMFMTTNEPGYLRMLIQLILLAVVSWVSYSRTAGDKLLVTVSMQKIN